ncbi:MAG: hypothetical protein ABJD07_01600 [Gemmatimonadaceae bacterium]
MFMERAPHMVDKAQTDDTTKPATPDAPATAVAPRRPPGHRSTDVRDTVAEMAARAQEISQEAGSKVSQAMKDVIGAAAGIIGFTVESARDLVQYMVRRGQMTQEEADRLLRDAEEAASKKRPASAAGASRADGPRPAARGIAAPVVKAPVAKAPVAKAPAPAKPAPVRPPAKVAAKKALPAKKPAKPAAKKPAPLKKPAKPAPKKKPAGKKR